MATATRTQTTSIAGMTLSWRSEVTGDSQTTWDPEFTTTEVKEGSAWTDVDANTGTLTFASDCGLATGTYDAYWTNTAGALFSRYGLTGTVAPDGLTIVLEGGAGDDFPATDADNDPTAMTVCEQVAIEIAFTGNDLKALAAAPTAGRAIITFTGSATVFADLDTDMGVAWCEGDGFENPFSGDTVTAGTVSSGYADGDNTVRFAILQDSTP